MRHIVVSVIMVAIWVLMFKTIYTISVESNYKYKELAKNNIEKKVILKPTRGEILDKNGKLLATNLIGFSVSIKPHLKTKSKEFLDILEILDKSFKNIDKKVLIKVYRKQNSPYNHDYITIINFVKYKDILKEYPKLNLNDSIRVDATTKRYYPYGRYMAHVVGYIGKANKKDEKKDSVVKVVKKIGKAGLERYYNNVLQGELGTKIVKVNAYNKVMDELESKQPKSNRDIKLTIDAQLQQYIYNTVEDSNETAVVIVMRTDGELLAAVSTPSYDPNLFVDGISSKDWKAIQSNLEHPFTNKLVHASYPLGSVIKMGVALATSKESLAEALKVETCHGYIKIGKSKHKFRCWSRWGHGKVDLRKSIRESCDVFYYNKALSIGVNKMAKHLREYGLGVKSGVDLPREYHGIIPDKKWKRKRYHQTWYKGETVIAAIGQGYTNVTLMQVARYTALLATNKLVTPHFASTIDGKPYVSNSKNIDFNSFVLQTVREGMYDVCNNKRGTAYKALHDLPIIVAGKTGTAQVASIAQDVKKRAKEEDLAYFKRSHAWLSTYAPYKNPKYVVSIIVEHGGHGGSTAGPIAAKIYNWMYQHNYFDKSKAMQNRENNESNQEDIELKPLL